MLHLNDFPSRDEYRRHVNALSLPRVSFLRKLVQKKSKNPETEVPSQQKCEQLGKSKEDAENSAEGEDDSDTKSCTSREEFR